MSSIFRSTFWVNRRGKRLTLKWFDSSQVLYQLRTLHNLKPVLGLRNQVPLMFIDFIQSQRNVFQKRGRIEIKWKSGIESHEFVWRRSGSRRGLLFPQLQMKELGRNRERERETQRWESESQSYLFEPVDEYHSQSHFNGCELKSNESVMTGRQIPARKLV